MLRLVASLLALAFAAPAAAAVLAPPAAPCDVAPLLACESPAWRRVERGTWTGHGAPERTFLVVEDLAGWLAFWEAHSADRFPRPPPPPVAFEVEWVAVLLHGEAPSTGHAIEALAVAYDRAGDLHTVRYATEAPCPGCGAGDALTRPFDVIAVARVASTPPRAVFVEDPIAPRPGLPLDGSL